ncbi:hypothetical protein F5B17DRAFT_429106 [Nemania serpens]|nr:hypothetical protein F5B17DRAFT_429106 [Nemania serpens]
MPKLLRPQTYPYAISSTGPYRGLLVRKYPCWEAKGPVRDLFMNEIAGKIKTCLEQCLPESNSFVGFSLFMVGKLPEKTKPTIMIVSDDKRRRKEAFQVVKSKNVLTLYGFELGHCAVAAEFEDLRQLGSAETTSSSSKESPDDYDNDDYNDKSIRRDNDGDEPGAEILSLLSAEACAFEAPDDKEPTRLYFNTPRNPHSHISTSATCGGLFWHQGDDYALTMAHAIHPIRRAVVSPEPYGDSSSQSDDFEITGMEDWDEDDEGGDTITLTAITSPGSQTPSELSDSEDSLLKRNDSRLSSDLSFQTRFAAGPSVIYEENCVMEDYEDDEDIPEICERVGSVIAVDKVLDIAVIKIRQNISGSRPLLAHPLRWFLAFDDVLTQTSITVKTTHHTEIKGQRSPTPFYTRLPGTDNFLELYSVQLRTPLRPGDSGSWAFNDKEQLAGFVVAGNPQTGSCLLLPAKQALQSVESLLIKRARPTGPLSADWPGLLSLAEAQKTVFGEKRDDDGMTVASSLPPPSIFSQRMDRGTPSTTTASQERRPVASLVRQGLSREDAGSASSFVSKGDFLEDQVARLRRELERAWEIIQEKDKHLQYVLTGNFNHVLRPPVEYMALPQSGLDYSLPFSPVEDSTQDRSQLSPSEQSHSLNVMVSDDSQTANPETTAAGHYFPTASLVQSVKNSLEAWKTKMNDTMEEQKTMWQAQVAANEALSKENKELKQGIIQARKEIWLMAAAQRSDATHQELLKVADNLGRVLHRNSDDPEATRGPRKVQKEPDQNEAMPVDIPSVSRPNQGLGVHMNKTHDPFRDILSQWGGNRMQGKPMIDASGIERPGERRILKPKSRLNSPLSSLRGLATMRGLRASLSDVGGGINTVPEEDEDKTIDDEKGH